VKWPAFSDTRSTLNELGLRGYRRIILSNVDRALLEETIEESGLDVDGYITAEDVRSYKPRKDHWLELLRRYDVSKDDVVHIAGSLYHDIIPASELGFKTIWVNRYGERQGPEAKPAISVRNLSEVLDIV
jgi:2-haloalkanoic acid dehalogenase type II